MLIIYIIYLFLQKPEIQTVGNGKKNFFQLFHFRSSSFFRYGLFKKCLIFRRRTPFIARPFHFLYFDARQSRMGSSTACFSTGARRIARSARVSRLFFHFLWLWLKLVWLFELAWPFEIRFNFFISFPQCEILRPPYPIAVLCCII